MATPQDSAQTHRHSFKDGKLYIFRRGLLDVARAWGPRAGAWRVQTQEGWMRAVDLPFQIRLARTYCRPSVSILSKYHQCRAVAYRQFLDSFPSCALSAVGPFRHGNWALLQLLNRCGEPAYQLMDSTPALLFLLAVRRRLSPDPYWVPVDSVRGALRRRQVRVLEQFGFPGCAAMIRVLRKLPSAIICVRTLEMLREMAQDPAAFRAACHLQMLNRSLLGVLCNTQLRTAVTFGFLEELANDRAAVWRAWKAMMLSDVLRMAALCGARLPPIRSLAMLHTVHDELAAAGLDIRTRDVSLDTEFPAPPLEGAAGIEPILTVESLRREAAEMRHCAWSYAGLVLRGCCYFYRVLAPDRATLCIESSGSGNWRLREIRGYENSSTPHRTVEAVLSWLGSIINPADAYAWPPLAEGDEVPF